MTTEQPLRFFRHVRFLMSAPSVNECPQDSGFEVAFAGRSNAGKSSALNTLTGQTKLARVSKTPGRTQQLNYFSVDDSRRLVDLPGYGYARVTRRLREEWQQHLFEWFVQRMCLMGLVLVMDIRHPMRQHDEDMLDLCCDRKMPVHILLTKADKLSQSEAAKTLNAVRADIARSNLQMSAQLFSSLKSRGVQELEAVLQQWLRIDVEGAAGASVLQ